MNNKIRPMTEEERQASIQRALKNEGTNNSRLSSGGPTMSVEELLRIRFDKFHKELEWKGIILSSAIKDALDDLEDNIIIDARTEYSTEAEEMREIAFEEGKKRGFESGYNEGYMKQKLTKGID